MGNVSNPQDGRYIPRKIYLLLLQKNTEDGTQVPYSYLLMLYKQRLGSECRFVITYFFNYLIITWLHNVRPIQSITCMLLSHMMMWKHSGKWGESMCTYTCACAPRPQDFFLHHIFKTRNSNENATNSYYMKHLKYKT
jgi:disulfide bond formation protein DsbB